MSRNSESKPHTSELHLSTTPISGGISSIQENIANKQDIESSKNRVIVSDSLSQETSNVSNNQPTNISNFYFL